MFAALHTLSGTCRKTRSTFTFKDACMLLWQELQAENASLKAKVAELLAVQKHDKEAFDRKLG